MDMWKLWILFIAMTALTWAGTVEMSSINYSEPVQIIEGTNSKSPDIAIDSKGVIHLVYTKTTDNKDAVYYRTYFKGQFSSEEIISPVLIKGTDGFEFEPKICLDSKEHIWVIWSSKRNNQWQIQLRMKSEDIWNPEITIPAANDQFHPVICKDTDNGIWFSCESLNKDTARSIYLTLVRDDGTLNEIALPQQKGISRNPTIIRGHDGTLWIAWENYQDKQNDIYLLKVGENRPVRVTSGPAYDTNPSLAIDNQNRVWISWSNDQQDDGSLGQARWFYLQCYDGKKFYEPLQKPNGKDLSKAGVDQSFECPQVKIDPHNRIWILGRSSQSFYTQYYSGDKWSDIKVLSNPEDWGGRGQFLRGEFDPDGNLWIVRRDVRKMLLQQISGGSGKSEALKIKPVHKTDTPIPQYSSASIQFHINDYSVYFGDIHTQSLFSDGVGCPEEIYARGRDRYQWDFMALTDHEDFVGNRISPTEWEYMKSITNSFNQPGRFVTLNAFEWTHARYPKGMGHKNVYFTQDDPPIFYHTYGDSTETKGLLDLIKPYKAVAIPHHIGWTGIDWENHDPELEPVIEIVSVHGAYEYMGNLPIKHRGGMKGHFIQDGLNQGLRFGIIGGSDTHGMNWQHGVSRKADSNLTGLTAILSNKLDRESILEALRNRRCYATSGAKIYIDFRIEGQLMGSCLTTKQSPEISFRVIGTGPIEYIHLIRDGKTIFSYGGDSYFGSSTYKDTDITLGTHYYYLRVIQKDGEMAWSSPVWVSME